MTYIEIYRKNGEYRGYTVPVWFGDYVRLLVWAADALCYLLGRDEKSS